MATVPLMIQVDEAAARAYESAPAEVRERVEGLVNEFLKQGARDSAGDSHQPAIRPLGPRGNELSLEERRARLRRAFGIWKDRDDLDDLRERPDEWGERLKRLGLETDE